VIMRGVSGIWRWLRRSFDRPRFRHVDRVSTLSDIPVAMPSDRVVLAGPSERPKWAVFMCPCDRGHRITLSLQSSHWPHWQLRMERGLPTFYPSIDVPNEWRCHYWIKGGRVRWAPNMPRF